MSELAGKRPLSGVNLLLVEDDPFVALELADLIRDLGGDIVGPFNRLARGLEAIEQDRVAGGVLDIRLNGDTTFPIVDILLKRADPVLLVSGGAEGTIPEKYRRLPRLRKPFDPAEFARLAAALFGRH